MNAKRVLGGILALVMAIGLGACSNRGANAYFSRGNAYRKKGDYDRAIADYDKAIELNPSHVGAYINCGDAYCMRGDIYYDKGDYDRAIVDYDKAIELNSSYVGAYISRGDAYCSKGDYARAIADATQAIHLDPRCTFAYLIRGNAYGALGELDEAIEDFAAAIRLDPGDAKAYSIRAQCYARRQEYQKAIADYGMAIRLGPHSACSYERRGAFWIERGHYDRGIVDIQTAIRLNPGDAAVSYEPWRKFPLSEAALQHGKLQVRQMVQDRPAMGRSGEQAQWLYDWAARKFAGEDLGRKIFWNASEPPPWAVGFSTLSLDEQQIAIQVASKYTSGPDKGKDRSFEETWRSAVFELYNIGNDREFYQLVKRAADNNLSKNEFVNRMIESESRAAEKTRALYIHMFLPWAKEHHVATHPDSWFLGWRFDPNDNLFHGRFNEEMPHWQHFERLYDRIVLHSLTRKGE